MSEWRLNRSTEGWWCAEMPGLDMGAGPSFAGGFSWVVYGKYMELGGGKAPTLGAAMAAAMAFARRATERRIFVEAPTSPPR